MFIHTVNKLKKTGDLFLVLLLNDKNKINDATFERIYNSGILQYPGVSYGILRYWTFEDFVDFDD